jgi:diacylglycerol kinase (ATP)
MPPAQPLAMQETLARLARNRPLRLGILSNDLSGGNRRDPDAVYRETRELPEVLYHRVRTPADVQSVLGELAAQQVDLIVINAGDGTIQAAFSTLLNDRPFPLTPPLALLVAGTTSMTAGDVGLAGRPVQAIRRLLKWARDPATPVEFSQRFTLCVETPAKPRPMHGMFFGTAAIHQAIVYCRQRIHTLGIRGEIGPGLALARFILAMARGDRRYVTPISLQIDIDQHPQPRRDYLVVMISTLQRLFLGMRPFWGTEPGPLRYTGIGASPGQVLRAMPSLLRGRQARHMVAENGYFSHNATELSLDLDSGFTLDGELLSPNLRLGRTRFSQGGRLTFIRV